MSTYFRQADLRWGSLLVGNGQSRMSAAGCAITSTAIAARILVPREPPLTPADVNRLAVTAGAFGPGSSAAVLAILARAAGLRCDAEDRRNVGIVGLEVVRDTVVDVFRRGGLCLLHVDHNEGLPGGGPAADHFVCGLRAAGGAVVYADPATGEEGAVALETLAGPARWGSQVRRYVVRDVLPVFAR